jgi:hypothetical protein
MISSALSHAGMKVAKRMKMRQTYIIFGLMRLVTRRDRGAIRGEDRLETRV